MDDDQQINPGLIVRQQKQVLDEIGSMRDDMAVMMAILMRQDATVTTLLPELRAMHSQHGRLANRLRALEERSP